MTGGGVPQRPDRLLTVAEAAELLSTTERFPRRLIEQRRIRFTRVGRHVRIPESALREFIAAGLVEPVTATTKKDAVYLDRPQRRQDPVRHLRRHLAQRSRAQTAYRRAL